MCAPERCPHGEEMIATAVRPIATPAGTRLARPAKCSRSTPNTHADPMKMPRAAASMRYSGQWARRASMAATRFETEGIAACTGLKDGAYPKYSRGIRTVARRIYGQHASDIRCYTTPIRAHCDEHPL